MKVKVRTEFKDKHTGELHKVGDELEMTVQRINEVIAAGNFIELVEQTEQLENTEQKQVDSQEEKADAGEQAAEETPKQTGRRKRTK